MFSFYIKLIYIIILYINLYLYNVENTIKVTDIDSKVYNFDSVPASFGLNIPNNKLYGDIFNSYNDIYGCENNLNFNDQFEYHKSISSSKDLKFLLLKKGKCSYVTKALNAYNSGYNAMVVFDSNIDSHNEWQMSIGSTSYSDDSSTFDMSIYAISISGYDGNEIYNIINNYNNISSITYYIRGSQSYDDDIEINYNESYGAQSVINNVDALEEIYTLNMTTMSIISSIFGIITLCGGCLICCATPRRSLNTNNNGENETKLIETLKEEDCKYLHRETYTLGCIYGMEEDGICAICLDSFDINTTVCILPCIHTYHEACICEWLTTGRNACPLCNARIDVDILKEHLDDNKNETKLLKQDLINTSIQNTNNIEDENINTKSNKNFLKYFWNLIPKRNSNINNNNNNNNDMYIILDDNDSDDDEYEYKS